MPKNDAGASFRLGIFLCVSYALLAWALLAKEALIFPLGGEDQRRVVAALGAGAGTPQVADSWVAGALDPTVALIFEKLK